MPVLARPEELAEQEWPKNEDNDKNNNNEIISASPAPAHNLINDLGVTNPVMVHTESDTSSTHSNNSEVPVIAPPAEINVNLRSSVSNSSKTRVK